MAETLDGLKIRIRELEKEVERWKSQVKSVRYGLNWMDVPEAFDKDSEDKIPILEEVAEKAVDAEGPLTGKPPHVIIEGDNYHALTCLNYTHRGKIDVIYIDPPYNTGSDGFTYKDKRFLTEFPDGQKVPKEHPLRHSYWLSFMEKRLKLAKSLLSDKGVIFISIDDNEQANLKLLCDRIFTENNFVGQIIIKSNPRGSMSETELAKLHEYVIIYARKSDCCSIQGQDLTEEMTQEYNLEDENGNKYRALGLRMRGGFWRKSDRPKLFYPIYVNPQNGAVSVEKERMYTEIVLPIQPSTGEEGTWRWSKEKVNTERSLLFGKLVKRNEKKFGIFSKKIIMKKKVNVRLR